MEDNIFLIDSEMTKRLGRNGIVVQQRQGTVLSAVYEISSSPPCPRCEQAGKQHGFLSTEFYDICEDDVHCDTPEIVKVRLTRRRFQCPKCRSEINIQLPFLGYGDKITDRLRQWIVDASLKHSFEDVSNILHGSVSSSHIRKIFREWVKTRDEDFYEHVATPDFLGIHHIFVGGNEYFAVSNLEQRCLIDLIPCSESALLSQLLIHLAARSLPKKIWSDFDWECVIPVRAIFRSDGVVISCESLLSSLTRLFLSIFEAKYKGAEKATIRRVISAPATKEYVTRNERNTASKRLLSYDVLSGLYASQLALIVREKVNNWNHTEFPKWKNSIPRCQETAFFMELIELCDKEINHSFLPGNNPDQFHEVGSKVTELIASNSKCSFEVLRAKLRYSKPPKLVYLKTGDFYYLNGMRKYEKKAFYAGVPLD